MDPTPARCDDPTTPATAAPCTWCGGSGELGPPDDRYACVNCRGARGRLAMHRWMQRSDGTRTVSMTWPTGVEVMLGYHGGPSQKAIDATAGDLAALGPKLLDARDRIAELLAENARLRAQVPPPAPCRTLGRGCVRFGHDGRLWLLNRPDRGWAEFGMVFGGWDELFRHYDVRVLAHGADAHGPYWITESNGAPLAG